MLSPTLDFGKTVSHFLPGLVLCGSIFMIAEVLSEIDLTAKITSSANYIFGAAAFAEDYRMAVVNADLAIKIELHKYLKGRLSHKQIASQSMIGKFLENTRSKYLLNVVLPLLDNWNSGTLEGCTKVIELRNEILRAPREKISKKESEESICAAESFLNFIGELAANQP